MAKATRRDPHETKSLHASNFVFAQHPESTSAGAERMTKMLQAEHSKANLDEAAWLLTHPWSQQVVLDKAWNCG